MAVLIVAIVAHLGVADEVREQLQNRFDSPGIAQDHVTAMLVINQLAFTLKILFSCATARSRRALGTVLTATLPPHGHISRYAHLLGLNRKSLRLKAAMRRRNAGMRVSAGPRPEFYRMLRQPSAKAPHGRRHQAARTGRHRERRP
jgi:hypothetical protein